MSINAFSSIQSIKSKAKKLVLLLNYKFETGDITGTTLKDYTGSSNGALSTGTAIYPTISTTTYKFGTGSMYFNQGNKQFLTIPTFTVPSSSVGFTVSMWYYLTTPPVLYSWLYQFSNGGTYSFGFQGNGGGLNYYIRSAGGTVYYAGLPVGGSGNTGVWHHLVMAVQATQTVFYLDGASATIATTYPPTSNTNNFINGFGPSPSLFNDFYADDFRIYRGALTNSEVMAIYNGTV